MPPIRTYSLLIIRCFKRIESFADWLTGAAGPWFVGICWTLTLLGGATFCEFPHSTSERTILTREKSTYCSYINPPHRFGSSLFHSRHS